VGESAASDPGAITAKPLSACCFSSGEKTQLSFGHPVSVGIDQRTLCRPPPKAFGAGGAASPSRKDRGTEPVRRGHNGVMPEPPQALTVAEPRLASDGLVLRAWDVGDLPALVAAGVDPTVRRFRYSIPNSDAQAQAWLTRLRTDDRPADAWS
jgi:hypothetical protein